MRRLVWGLGGLALLAVAALGALSSVAGAGALVAGANRGSWIFRFVLLVVAPLAPVGSCASQAFRPRGQ
jgi:hypothetical protein